MSGGQERGDVAGEVGNTQLDDELRYAEQEAAWSDAGRSNGTGNGGNDRQDRPEKPKRDWIDYLTVVALIATFCAAFAAAVEADRLARDTEIALSDARVAAGVTHADNVRTENLTADALGQAQSAANDSRDLIGIARDSATAANTSAGAATSQAATSKREAAALERSSFSGRPFLFIDVKDRLQGPPNPPGINCQSDFMGGGPRTTECVGLEIVNYGDTPAVITSVESHLAATDVIPMSGRPPTTKWEVSNEPIQIARGDNIVYLGGSWNPNSPGTDALVVPAHSSTGEGRQLFVFDGMPSIAATASRPVTIDRRFEYQIAIRYRDVYGCFRQTRSVVPLNGKRTFSPEQENNWDTEPCNTAKPKEVPPKPPSWHVHGMGWVYCPNADGLPATWMAAKKLRGRKLWRVNGMAKYTTTPCNP